MILQKVGPDKINIYMQSFKQAWFNFQPVFWKYLCFLSILSTASLQWDLDFIYAVACSHLLLLIYLLQENMSVSQVLDWMVLKCLHAVLQLILFLKWYALFAIFIVITDKQYKIGKTRSSAPMNVYMFQRRAMVCTHFFAQQLLHPSSLCVYHCLLYWNCTNTVLMPLLCLFVELTEIVFVRRSLMQCKFKWSSHYFCNYRWILSAT